MPSTKAPGASFRAQFAAQVASTQASVAAQSLAILHCGVASPGVTQKPAWQTTALVQVQQSSLVWHSLRQTALTQTCPVQSELEWQPGVAP